MVLQQEDNAPKPTPGATCNGKVLVTHGLPSLSLLQTLHWGRNWVAGIKIAFSVFLEVEKPCKFCASQAGLRGTESERRHSPNGNWRKF